MNDNFEDTMNLWRGIDIDDDDLLCAARRAEL